MNLQYSSKVLLLIASVVVLSSCLKSEQTNTTLSPDAQIYAISFSSSKDKTGALLNAKFTIDQIQSKIFNKDSLPYLFRVDSVIPRIVNNANLTPKITIHLKDKDSSYVWNGKDSVAINRLEKITSTALNGNATITYSFQLNTHKQDPNLLTWSRLATNYIPGTVETQKTAMLGNRFYTYYKSGAEIKGVSSATTDGKTWNPININGLPLNTHIKSILSVANVMYALDSNNGLYTTSDGMTWKPTNTQYPIKAIFGVIPTSDQSNPILTIVNDAGTLKFATTKDFISFQLQNIQLPAGINVTDFPIKDFSSVSLVSTKSFAAKFLVVSGGTKTDNTQNNAVWLVQMKESKIEIALQEASISLQNASLFFYNNLLYLLSEKDGKNILYYSDDSGLHWQTPQNNQALPADFAFRKSTSIITDANNYIWIFGGESTTQQIVDVWRAKLNALGN